jgi:FdhD protein
MLAETPMEARRATALQPPLQPSLLARRGPEAAEADAAELAVSLTRWSRGEAVEAQDAVAHEEPLELQLQGLSVAVVMRTPGHDEDLALGFLRGEGVIASMDDVLSVHPCSEACGDAEDNVVRVLLREGVRVDLERLRRNLYTSSSCGLCGKASIEAVLRVAAPVTAAAPLRASRLYAWPQRLRAAQPTFDSTGGLHAAGLFHRLDEAPPLVREDVGRHNAVDKVVGALLRGGGDPADFALLVSGRISFELVQKVAAAGIPALLGVSAPTSLAVRAAAALGVTVVGFLRGEHMNIYTHPHRVVGG